MTWTSILLLLLFPPVQSESVPAGYPEAIELLHTNCSDPDGFSIDSGLVYLDAQRFDPQSLSEYFAPFLDNPAEGEVYLTVTADRPKVELRRNPPPPEGPPPPKPAYPFPNPMMGPLAYFYRLGGNAIFQFRDTGGEAQWVVLQGRNVFLDNPWRLQFQIASHYFRSRLEDERICQNLTRQVGLVLGSLPQMSFEETDEVLLYFDRVFSQPGSLTLTIYEDVGSAQFREEAIFPSLDFGLDGTYDRHSRRASLFRSMTGHRTIVIYQGGKLLHHRNWTP